VIENGVSTILGEGLGYDRCQVGVITNIEPTKHFGEYYIETIEQVYNVMRTQVDVVLQNGAAVLNAEDPLVAQMAELCDGEVIFFACNADLELVNLHLGNAGRAVLLHDGFVVLANGKVKTPLVSLAAIPALNKQSDVIEISSFLASVAAAWALGIPLDLIITGIKTFATKNINNA
jgi:cyanophycin synthetase